MAHASGSRKRRVDVNGKKALSITPREGETEDAAEQKSRVNKGYGHESALLEANELWHGTRKFQR